MTLSDWLFLLFCAGTGCFAAYILGHSNGWRKGFDECSEMHAPKGKGGAL